MSTPPTRRLPAVGLVDAGDQIEQRALARTGRPHQRDVIAGGNVERDVGQHRHDLAAAPVGLGEIADRDDRAGRIDPSRYRRDVTFARQRPRTVTRAPSRSFSGGRSTTLSPALHTADGPRPVRRSCRRSRPRPARRCRRLITNTTLLPSRCHHRRRLDRRCARVRSPSGTSSRQKRHLGAHLRQDARIEFVKTDLGHHGRLGAIDGRHQTQQAAAETHVGQRIELDFARLVELDLAEVRFRHVGLDLQRRHVGHRHHRRLRTQRRRKRRDDVADVGVLGQHHAVERRADQRLLDADLRRRGNWPAPPRSTLDSR